ncbi:MAG: GlsB/YeaQ/YmgE family stress response membrane protein [Bryobacteraceae bacterium]
MFGIIGTIIFGLIVGIVAKLLMPGKDPGGFFVTAIIGIVGSLVGGYLGRMLGLYGPGDAAGFIMSVIGALLLLFIYHLAVKRTA